jgi:DNA repair protein RecN (Recombination protein N)
MLKTLDIRTLVLIDHLTLEASAGLTVLTGETGAGKSILLDALGLIRGDRADAGLVRTGAEAAIVTAVLSLPPDHLVLAELSAAGVVIDDDEIRLKREQRVDGKSRAFINEQPVGVQTLKSVGRLLIDLHGQFDTGALFDPSTHRDMADRFAGLFAHRGQVADAWASVSSARAELQAAQATAANSARDAEYRRGLLDEIKKLSPEDGEEDRLLVRKQMLSHQEQVREGPANADPIIGR